LFLRCATAQNSLSFQPARLRLPSEKADNSRSIKPDRFIEPSQASIHEIHFACPV